MAAAAVADGDNDAWRAAFQGSRAGKAARGDHHNEEVDGGENCAPIAGPVGGAQDEADRDREEFTSLHTRSFSTLEAIRRIRRTHAAARNYDAESSHDASDNRGIYEGGTSLGSTQGGKRRSDERFDGADHTRKHAAPAEVSADGADAVADGCGGGGFHSGDGTLRLLLVGADRMEGTSPRATAAVFQELLCSIRGATRRARARATTGRLLQQGGTANTARRQLCTVRDEDADAMDGVRCVDILLVGPNLLLDQGVDAGVFHLVPADGVQDEDSDNEGQDSRCRHVQLRIAYHVGMYHDLKRRNSHGSPVSPGGGGESDATPSPARALDPALAWFVPDLALAFNAGMWGYSPEEWRPTVEQVLHSEGCPLVVTGYTLEEAENDEDALREMLSLLPQPPGLEGERENVPGGARARDGVSVEEPGACGHEEAESGGAGDGDGSEIRDGVGDGDGDSNARDKRTPRAATVEWLWEAELNPFRSLRKRELEFDSGRYLDEEQSFMGENCGWLCLVSSAGRWRSNTRALHQKRVPV
jgi:hypothetical protein